MKEGAFEERGEERGFLKKERGREAEAKEVKKKKNATLTKKGHQTKAI